MGAWTTRQKLALIIRWMKHQVKGVKLRHLTIEVTKRCNARCPFCLYWQEARQAELADYSPIVDHFKPLVVTLSGGEPLLRKDLDRVVRQIREKDPSVYITMVTNASLLSLENAKNLYEAGLNQISISLDYAGRKHDEVRGLPGNYEKIVRLLPGLADIGFKLVVLNTVIKNDNLEDIPKLIDLARDKGAFISFSSHCSLKTGKEDFDVSENNRKKLEDLIEYIKNYKKKYPVITSSDYYLDRVIAYFRAGEIPGCLAGVNWIQITPGGEIKPCSELPVTVADFKAYDARTAEPVACTSCWYCCRGEAQAPVTWKRIREIW
jgi:MoaA/NifB/PqqE/SkfB family radical SAM enzyme